MRIFKVLGIILSLTAPAFPQSTFTLYHGDSSPDMTPVEIHIKSWLQNQPSVRKKISQTMRGAMKLREANAPTDLKDSLAQKLEPAMVRERILHAEPQERAVLIKQLPGMKNSPMDVCAALEYCPQEPLSFRIEDPSKISDGIVALIRPWALLQKARSRQLELIADPGRGGRIIKMRLEDVPEALLEIQLSAESPEGFEVRLRGTPDPDTLFKEQRHAALRSSRPALSPQSND